MSASRARCSSRATSASARPSTLTVSTSSSAGGSPQLKACRALSCSQKPALARRSYGGSADARTAACTRATAASIAAGTLRQPAGSQTTCEPACCPTTKPTQPRPLASRPMENSPVSTRARQKQVDRLVEGSRPQSGMHLLR